jgi:hypothetical protein
VEERRNERGREGEGMKKAGRGRGRGVGGVKGAGHMRRIRKEYLGSIVPAKSRSTHRWRMKESRGSEGAAGQS